MGDDPRAKSIDELRSQYARLSDFDIADLYSQGRGAFVSDAVWNAISEQYRERQLVGSETVKVVEEERALEVKKAAVAGTLAPFFARAFQGLADMAVAWIIGWVLGFVLAIVVSPFSSSDTPRDIGQLIGFFAYQPVFEARSQATPAMRHMNLRVVTPLGRRPGFVRLLARSLLRPLGLVGPLWFIIWGTWWGHDVLTGTRVVQTSASDVA